MTTEPYEEIVGRAQSLDASDPYVETGALKFPCPPPVAKGCGAVIGVKCTFETEEFRAGLGLVKITSTRHSPCLVRYIGKGKSNA
ncbi:hypothetical protein EV580_1339 [Mycobacterium sp. BK086]|nr:hypothetical protein EV580_1339 [Mycobacterium sp. BK086]